MPSDSTRMRLPETVLVRLQVVACFAPLNYGFAVVNHQHEPSVQQEDAVWPAHQS